MRHKAPLSQRSPRFPQLCCGEDSRCAATHSYSCWHYVSYYSSIAVLVYYAIQLKKNYHIFWCTGWQSGGIHSWWISLPECRVASLGLGKVQYYSSSGNSKDGPSKSSSGDAPSAESVLSAVAKVTPASSGDKLVINVCLFFAFCVQLYCAYLCSLFSLLFYYTSCALVGSTPQGLTKVETIQVKGEQNLCMLHVKQIINKTFLFILYL